ncbi:MAG: hypothetical protein LUB59_04030 [Candidatus Gastranaerophilales bacterium]|nr:hypothetical protein [Candidatus Gastranaerophilales bacterium]
MGIDIDKLSQNTYVPYELTEISRLNSKKVSAEEAEEAYATSAAARQTMSAEPTSAAAKKTDKNKQSNGEENIDTYKKNNVVSNSIEQQIQEQEAKIKEINKNLAVLRENYSETGDAEDDARSIRYQKSRDLHTKELSENSLKRIFASWTKKYSANENDESILKEYNLSSSNFDDATVERILADKAYDVADADAIDAISAHNSSSSQLISGLWGKRDAYWDLAKMQRRLAFAKLKENS